MPKEEPNRDVLTVDGIEYSWQQRHGWGVDYGLGIRGISVSVWLHRDRTRELILDFPFSMFGTDASPRRSHLLPHVADGIRLAADAGWDSESRGKAFRYVFADSSSTPSRQ